MAPSHKRKRKALPKRPCPCCSAVLSEKTIERHLEGTYLPTHIKVARAAAAPHKRPRSEKTHISTSSSDLSSDLSSDSSDISSDSTVDDFGPSGRSEAGEVELELETVNNAQTGSDPRNVNGTWAGSDAGARAGSAAGSDNLEEIIQDTWSRRRARVDDYESDTESEDFNEDADSRDSGSDVDSEFESPEMGTRNGLEMDDLVDEDFQRLIAEFGALALSHRLPVTNTITVQLRSFPRRTSTCSGPFP